jgi:hypothetical protein
MTHPSESRHVWIVYTLASVAFVVVGLQSASDWWHPAKRWIGLIAVAVGLGFSVLAVNLWRRKSVSKRP